MGVFKNDVGRPSNKTVKIKKIFKIICVLLVLTIGGFIGYILNHKNIIWINIKNNKNIWKINKVTTTKNKGLISDSDARQLFADMNVLNESLSLLDKNGLVDYWSYFYTFEKLENKDVDNNVKLGISIAICLKEKFNYIEYNSQIAKQIIKSSLNESLVEEKYKDLFGNNIENYNIDYDVLGFSVNYNKKLKKYTFDYADVGDSSSAKVISEIYSVDIKKEEVIIISKAMFLFKGFSEKGEEYSSIYKDVKLDDYYILKPICEKINEYSCYYGVLNKIADNPTNIEIDNYSEKINTYKWIFKRVNEKYIFESMQKIS